MRNRPFVLPVPKSSLISYSDEEIQLKNKYSGRSIFRKYLFYLVTGDLSILDKTDNKWFFEEIFDYSLKNHDPNLVAALKKISEGNKYEESIRQRATEINEIIEERSAVFEEQDKISLNRTEYEKAEAARKLMAGIRFPQTTDILRLLREKSVELKRLALFLVGKFHMTDMTQEVCECLGVQGIESDAVYVLLSLGQDIEGEINRYYLIQSGNVTLSKTILRIYSRICPGNNMSFLLERLWSNSRQLKEIAVNALIECGYKSEKEELGRLIGIIFDTFGHLARLSSCKVCLSENKNQILYTEMDKEYTRWKGHLQNLLAFTYGDEIPGTIRKNFFEKDDIPERFIPELANIVYGNTLKGASGSIQDEMMDRKTYKKLQRFFPGDLPRYKELLEDIINCDYNLIGIWTKACTLHNIKAIEGENMAESVVALLFSPEEILMEEAALLIARSGKELYSSTSERIPDTSRMKLDQIISGNIDQNDLVLTKVEFLASCLEGVNEDDLLMLADKIIHIPKGNPFIEIEPEGYIIWSFRQDNNTPDFNLIYEHSDPSLLFKRLSEEYSFSYLLPFKAVDSFSFQYPEHSSKLLKYIDDNES